MGVPVERVLDALTNPVDVEPPRENTETGELSQAFFGKDCTVNINPDTGRLIQVQPFSGDNGMFKMKPESEAFLREHFSEEEAERMLNTDDMKEILHPLNGFLMEKGFGVDWILNDLGRKTERVYDDIYYSNVNKEAK